MKKFEFVGITLGWMLLSQGVAVKANPPITSPDPDPALEAFQGVWEEASACPAPSPAPSLQTAIAAPGPAQDLPQSELEPTAADLTGVSTQAADLGEPNLQQTCEESPPQETAQLAPDSNRELRLSPLERPFTQLFGFETATPLQAKDLVLFAGGSSFNNPDDFRGDDNRSNDLRFGAAYGITDDLQLSVGVFGKDDTIFSNLVRNNSDLQLIYGGIPAQLKWRFYNQERLSSALVVGAEFPFQTVPESAVSGSLEGINPRQILFGTGGSQLLGENTLLAVDNTPYFSVAVPISYQVAPKARLHLNPQVSVFPDAIEVRAIRGNVAALEAANIGLEGDRLDYYGTVAGIGVGFDYSLTPRLQLAADITPVVVGQNSVGSGGDNSLFVTRPVWNAGVRFAPSSRLGINLYATNRFGPIAAAPSNLLAQPGGNWGVGLDFIYLPDVAGNYAIEARDTYPDATAFLSLLNGFPSATLPINSILYELAAGSRGRVAPTLRVGLLDDFELAAGFNLGSTDELKYEGFVLGRLALLPDRGQEGLSAAIGFGASGFESSINSTEFGLYAELPLRYRLTAANLALNVTPKVAIPVQALGVSPIFGISLGTTWSVAPNTQLLAQVTPILTGENELQNTPVPGQLISLQDRSLLYSLGVRQLFPSGNSLYALDLYFGNSVADYGYQGLAALPEGGTQVGLRFSILNGVPGL